MGAGEHEPILRGWDIKFELIICFAISGFMAAAAKAASEPPLSLSMPSSRYMAAQAPPWIRATPACLA